MGLNLTSSPILYLLIYVEVMCAGARGKLALPFMWLLGVQLMSGLMTSALPQGALLWSLFLLLCCQNLKPRLCLGSAVALAPQSSKPSTSGP